MAVDLGDSVTRSINLTSAAGAAVDADSTPTYAVILPSGTPDTPPAVQHTTTGEYYVVYPTIAEGLHREVWTAVVAGVPVVMRRNFTVEAVDRDFVDTDEVIEFLAASGVIVEAAELEWLRWLCALASSAVEDDLGRVIAARPVTVTEDGGRSAILLTSTPVLSVTTVVENGVTLAASDYTVDLAAGIIYRGGQQSPHSWAWGRQNITITLRAGFLNPPRVARDVAMAIVGRRWQSTRQMPHPAMDDIDAALQAVAAQSRTPGEIYRAYNNLRAPGFA